MTELVTIKVSRRVADEIERQQAASFDEILSSLATEFVEMTSIGTPIKERHFNHSLTGKTLVVSAKWLDEAT